MRFLPREEKFYHLFLQQVEVISEAARVLLDGLKSGSARMASSATEIALLERQGDELIHEIFTRLNQTFITPIDPEDITTAFAAHLGVPVVPCGCSQKTGTVRRLLRGIFAEIEREHPHLQENILSAMGNIDTGRLLDPRFFAEDASGQPPELPPIVTGP